MIINNKYRKSSVQMAIKESAYAWQTVWSSYYDVNSALSLECGVVMEMNRLCSSEIWFLRTQRRQTLQRHRDPKQTFSNKKACFLISIHVFASEKQPVNLCCELSKHSKNLHFSWLKMIFTSKLADFNTDYFLKR